MSEFSGLVQAGAAIVALIFTYMKLSGQQKRQVKTFIFRVGACLGAFIVFASSVIEIVKFGTSNLPLTRHDVLWLLTNLWNGAFYGLSGLVLAIYWSRHRKSDENNTAGDD